MRDVDGKVGDVSGNGQGGFEVIDPDRFVLAIAHQPPEDGQLVDYLRQSLLSTAARLFSEALSRGEWKLKDMVAPERAGNMASVLQSGYRDLGATPPGLAVSVDSLQLTMPDVAQAMVSTFSPGIEITVIWSDGNRYIGFVQKNGPGQVLILFAGGAQHWVPVEFIHPAIRG
jgi:hypothetical protein